MQAIYDQLEPDYVGQSIMLCTLRIGYTGIKYMVNNHLVPIGVLYDKIGQFHIWSRLGPLV